MRLTLRTLLAYLDEILDPSDATELAKKIRESDFASGLVHRIRSSMGRLRLSAPQVVGKGMGTDPNSVAEYLDNTLAVERVPDFEKVCLESDMHLAEVASCHQILTLVLGEAAHVQPALRNRIYALGTQSRAWKGQDAFQRRVDEAIAGVSSGNGAQPAGQPLTSPGTRPRRTSRQTGNRLWALGLTLLLAFAVTTVVLVVRGLWPSTDIAQNPTTNVPEPPMPEVTPPAPALRSVEATPAPDRESVFVDSPPTESSPRELTNVASPRIDQVDQSIADSPPLAAESVPADNDLASDTTLPDVAPPPVAAPFVMSRPAAVPAPAPEDTAAMLGAPTDTTLTAPEGTPEPPRLAVLDNPPMPEASLLDAGVFDNNTASRREATAPAATETTPVGPAAPAVAAVDAGRNILNDQVLAYWDQTNDVWQRLPARAPLMMNQPLRVPVAFRPQVLLSNGMQGTLNGHTELMFVPSADAGHLAVRWDRGQAVLVGMGQQPGSISFEVDQHQVQVSLGDANAEFAVHLQRFHNPGTDPRVAPRHVLFQLWGTSGQVGVQINQQDSVVTVAAGQRLRTIDLREPVIEDVPQFPAWMTGRELRDIDRKAALEIEPKLVPDRSLTLTLSELAGYRRARTDVRSLAARCLASFDRYEHLVEGLADPRMHAVWTAIFQELRAGVARDPQSAEMIWGVLQRTQGPDAEKTFRMLWGYTPSELRKGVAAELVDDLEHDALEVRVLAIENLKEITGGMSLLYRPDRPASNRRVSVQNWRKRLEAGQIAFKQPPLSVEPEAAR